MDNIEQIMGQMERAENPHPITSRFNDPRYVHKLEYDCFRAGAEAQCLKLAKQGWMPSEPICEAYGRGFRDSVEALKKQGWRKVPSEEEIADTIRIYLEIHPPVVLDSLAKELRAKWLMGGEDG